MTARTWPSRGLASQMPMTLVASAAAMARATSTGDPFTRLTADGLSAARPSRAAMVRSSAAWMLAVTRACSSGEYEPAISGLRTAT